MAEEIKKKKRKKEAAEAVSSESVTEAAEATEEGRESIAFDTQRYDLLIVSQRPGYKAPKSAIMTLVHQLSFRGFASPKKEALAQEWAEIYFEAGPSAHEPFALGEYAGYRPVFHEAVIKVYNKDAFKSEYGTIAPLYFCIEFRGCVYKDVLGSFKKIFQEALNLKLETYHRDFATLPPHRVVPENELPVEDRKRERGEGLVGTTVIER